MIGCSLQPDDFETRMPNLVCTPQSPVTVAGHMIRYPLLEPRSKSPHHSFNVESYPGQLRITQREGEGAVCPAMECTYQNLPCSRFFAWKTVL
jgi:hypothetical protein